MLRRKEERKEFKEQVSQMNFPWDPTQVQIVLLLRINFEKFYPTEQSLQISFITLGLKMQRHPWVDILDFLGLKKKKNSPKTPKFIKKANIEEHEVWRNRNCEDEMIFQNQYNQWDSWHQLKRPLNWNVECKFILNLTSHAEPSGIWSIIRNISKHLELNLRLSVKRWR